MRVPTILGALVLATASLSLTGAPASAKPVYTPPLEVAVDYSDPAAIRLKAITVENKDGLPEYSPSLTNVATGEPIPLGAGWTEMTSGDIEMYYRVSSAAPVAVGTEYEFHLTIETVAHWSCSIYNPNGCSWIEADSETYQWRFMWNGSATTGTPYYPELPGPDEPTADPGPARSKVTVKKLWYWPKAWKIHGSLTCDGDGLRRAELVSQVRGTRGPWKKYQTLQSDRWGDYSVKVPKVDSLRGTEYRVVYAGGDKKGTAICSAAKSMPITL